MAKAHKIVPQLPLADVTTAILGTSTLDTYTDKEVGKLVKLSASDTYSLAAAGDAIEGFIVQVETGTSAGRTVGGIVDDKKQFVTADGLQATPGTGTIAAGDYVVVGTVVAKGTAMSGYPKVTKATDQAAAKAAPFAWRVVSLGTAGTGAVGTVIVIART